MIQYRMAGLKVFEFHFDEPIQERGADIIRYRSRTEPFRPVVYEEAHTLEVDLRPDPDALMANLHRNVRYPIRKASKLNLSYSSSSGPGKEWISEFATFYNRFATAKKIAPANTVRLNALRSGGALDMSKISAEDGRTLVWHVHIRTPSAVRLLYSGSLFREQEYAGDAVLIGHANRYQHWLDMLRFREAGVIRFDFGGFYAGTEDASKLRINEFKAGFGGQVVRRFNSDHPVTWPGSVLLGLKKASSIQRAIDFMKLRYSQ